MIDDVCLNHILFVCSGITVYCSHHVGNKNTYALMYNTATRDLFYVPIFYIVSHMFVSINVPTCETVISNLMYKSMCRLDKADTA